MQTPTRENPIIRIGNRDDDEFQRLLQNTTFREIVNNRFTEKYRIYLYQNNTGEIINEKITGYIVEYYNYDCSNPIENTFNKYFEILFVDCENNFYILSFEYKEIILNKIKYFFFGNHNDYNYNTEICNSKKFQDKKNVCLKILILF